VPPHLYFQVDAVPILGNNQKVEFMGQIDWLFKLRILGEEYTLISCGYWGNDHYWGKVLRTVKGVTGVWLHNNLDNVGYAQMVSFLPGSISAGAHPNTSWLIYFQPWTQDEAVFVDASIDRICCNNPTISSAIPFTHMKSLLNISYKGVLSTDESKSPKTSDPPKIENQVDSNNTLGDSSHEGSKTLSTEDSGNDLSEESGQDFGSNPSE
jgi:hypothetical protein